GTGVVQGGGAEGPAARRGEQGLEVGPRRRAKDSDTCRGIGPQVGGSGAEGIGFLQGMASLSATAALTAPADVDVGLAVNGLARDLELGFPEWSMEAPIVTTGRLTWPR